VTRALAVSGAGDRVREEVRSRYAAIASGRGCCGASEGGGPASRASCCGGGSRDEPSSSPGGARGTPTVLEMGYGPEELAHLPGGSDLGLGCGNPTGLLSLRRGETVVDLGSGAGIDCFLAARKVGRRGRVIGVDMTPEMIARARANARQGDFPQVEFRLGEIEHLPLADASADVLVSNCVINLAPDQGAVYREAFRVLRPGGRLAVSDVVATRPIPKAEREDPALWSSCASGAASPTEIRHLLRRAGFVEVEVELAPAPRPPKGRSGPPPPGVVPANIRAVKPLA
jgi:arsenite methyltransferase